MRFQKMLTDSDDHALLNSTARRLASLAWPSPPTATAVVGFVKSYRPTPGISSPANADRPTIPGAVSSPPLHYLTSLHQTSLLFSLHRWTIQQAGPGMAFSSSQGAYEPTCSPEGGFRWLISRAGQWVILPAHAGSCTYTCATTTHATSILRGSCQHTAGTLSPGRSCVFAG